MSETTADPSAPFFAVSPVRLAVLSVAAGPIYPLYWFYRSWSHIQQRAGHRLQPLAQTVVAPFSTIFLLQRFRSATGGWPSWASGLPVLVLLFIPQLFARIPGPPSLAAELTLVPLLLINLFATRANVRTVGTTGIQRNWSRGEVALLAVFIPLNVFATYDLLLGTGAA